MMESKGSENPSKRQRTSSSYASGPEKDIAVLLKEMEDYEPTIPDAVTTHYLEKVGFSTDDKRLKRLVALATQKFLYEIIHDALQYSKLGKGAKDKSKKKILKMEHLALSLKLHGINVVKRDFLVDSLETLKTMSNQ
mmetsp:Transcript_32388/g.45159  ORF Transcript_32388/g.45159 Transcript_32388/m.45159 type:complete len:137 (-) Transcript_32388:32-442(-)|eukprot:CAMPEP_0185263418 /NCGR_PEP_ID=MMETSP1359-20130426/15177_1 /TAXON_ID=552665 /ORGANISM="Bigelowiella longifila, Strain CCMP242" /LENGTH=136 /DNA_ID=CAMNT_0027850951 /DNA_START=85 /DNA_END=498 /DNA_ORIENTATION=-